MHKVSVIVSNFNGAKWLPRLLETLKAQAGVEVEIIIVDRNSTDESDSILAQHPEVKVHKHPPETGLVCGYDEGVPHASHDLLFFCNEDMWFEPECLKRVCEAIDLPARVGAVMPVQWTYDMKDIVNCGAWFKKSWWCPSNPNPFRYSVWQLKEETSPVSGINAGACLVHRRVYEEIGGWDRTFFLDYEDMDLSIRLWQHGWDCLVVPSAKVGHAVGASNNKALNNGFKVSRKRYIGGTSNVIACAMKCFTGPSTMLPVIALGDRFLRNLLSLRLERAWWDVLSALDAFKRLPDFLEYRGKNQQWNSQRPGQKFFVDPRFRCEA